MRNLHRIALVALWLGICALAPAAHAQRVALLIGNANYQVGRLSNPPQDVQAMETALGNIGFKVQKVLNANQNQMKRAVRDFGTSAQGAEIAFLYYSGHGTQANGENYLLPVGASIDKESDYAIEAIAANDVLQQIRGARPKAAILVLDACRDNPLAATTRSTTKGLSRMDAPTGTMIAFATAPNTVASDNGEYAKVLARELQKPGQELIDVFRNTTEEVLKRSNGKQEPRISEMSIVNRLYLAGKPPEPGAGTQVASVRAEPVIQTARPGQSSGLSLDDLEKEEATRKEWSAWQSRMKADYDKTAAFQGSSDLQAKAWERFLGTWSQDNPLSSEDDTLRQQARQKLESTRAQATRPTAAPQQVTTASTTATSSGISAGQVFKDCADCPEMVAMPAGSFEMGGSEADEKPVHSVSIKSFAMGKTPVTQGQWQAVMGSNPSHFQQCGANCPVENVSWDDAQAFIQKLNTKSGKQYRLPSEAEWEYACRAGGHHAYCGSDNVDAVAWYSANGRTTTHPVAGKQANAFGLYDMSGNVWQWLEDYFHDRYSGAPTDGSAWTTGGEQKERVLRGGSWNDYPADLRSALRLRGTPDIRSLNFGFRVAKTLSPLES